MIYDHYKETCSIVRDSIKFRDRLMLFVIITLAFFSFQSFFPITSNQVVSELLTFKLGLNLQFNFAFLGSIIWFLLLIFVLRYFQTAVYIERQYKYIHNLEEQLNKEFKEDIITREGKSYLSKYPLFSDWMCFLYTIFFPILLFLITLLKIISELINSHGVISVNIVIDTIIFLILSISIFLYVKMLHFDGKKKGDDEI